MSTSMKKVGIVGAETAALSAMAMCVASEVVEAEMPEPMTRQVRCRMERKGR